jgi:hypothetical protein
MGKFQLRINYLNECWNVDVLENLQTLISFKNCENEQQARALGRAFIEGIFYTRGE